MEKLIDAVCAGSWQATIVLVAIALAVPFAIWAWAWLMRGLN